MNNKFDYKSLNLGTNLTMENAIVINHILCNPEVKKALSENFTFENITLDKLNLAQEQGIDLTYLSFTKPIVTPTQSNNFSTKERRNVKLDFIITRKRYDIINFIFNLTKCSIYLKAEFEFDPIKVVDIFSYYFINEGDKNGF